MWIVQSVGMQICYKNYDCNAKVNYCLEVQKRIEISKARKSREVHMLSDTENLDKMLGSSRLEREERGVQQLCP